MSDQMPGRNTIHTSHQSITTIFTPSFTATQSSHNIQTDRSCQTRHHAHHKPTTSTTYHDTPQKSFHTARPPNTCEGGKKEGTARVNLPINTIGHDTSIGPPKCWQIFASLTAPVLQICSKTLLNSAALHKRLTSRKEYPPNNHWIQQAGPLTSLHATSATSTGTPQPYLSTPSCWCYRRRYQQLTKDPQHSTAAPRPRCCRTSGYPGACARPPSSRS